MEDWASSPTDLAAAGYVVKEKTVVFHPGRSDPSFGDLHSAHTTQRAAEAARDHGTAFPRVGQPNPVGSSVSSVLLRFLQQHGDGAVGEARHADGLPALVPFLVERRN